MNETGTRRRIVVTGAAGAIGEAVCRVLSTPETDLLLVGRRREKLEALATELVQRHGRVGMTEVVACDLGRAEEVAAVTGRWRARGMQFDALCHCAGISRVGPLAPSSAEVWDELWRANVSSVVLLTGHTADLMRTGASIVTFGSTAGLRPIAEYSAYTTTKAAVIHFSQAAALELAPRGVRVNCICPGVVPSPIHEDTAIGDRDLFYEAMRRATPMRRLGTPEEIAGVVAFLVGDAARWITGAVVTADGGLSLT